MFEQTLDFVCIHFPASSFCGRVQVGCRGRSSSIVPALTCDYDLLASQLSTFSFSPNADYYLTANAFSGVRRVLDDLFALHNIVVDIDCHEDLSLSVREYLIGLLSWRLDHDLWGTVFPPPTTKVYTGRGLQLWWSLVGISYKFKPFYDELVTWLCDVLESSLKSSLFDDLSMFSVDRAASLNAIGYFRMPGTINTKSKCLATYVLQGEQYELMALYDHMKISREKSIPEALPSDIPVGLVPSDWVDIAERRVASFARLRKLRGSKIDGEERNNFSFMVYNALVPCYGHDLAFERVKSFNQGFLFPMTERELSTVVVSAKRKGGYQYSDKAVLEFLSISEDEAQKIQFFKDSAFISKKTQKKVQVYTKKQDRNEKILALFSENCSKTKIAEMLGVSYSTVSSVIQESGQNVKKNRASKIFGLKKDGFSVSEIATACKCSARTVERALKKAPSYLLEA